MCDNCVKVRSEFDKTTKKEIAKLNKALKNCKDVQNNKNKLNV